MLGVSARKSRGCYEEAAAVEFKLHPLEWPFVDRTRNGRIQYEWLATTRIGPRARDAFVD